MTRKTSRREKGITLIALIVTIIVLLILAGVTINLAVNNQGIFNKAKTATRAYKNASENEQMGLDEADKEIAKYMPKEGSEGGSGSESSGGTTGGGTSTSGGSGISGTGTTIAKDSYPAITVTGLIYADLDGDTSTAEGLVVATSDGSAVTASTTMPDGYTMSDYAGESKTASGKIITTTTSGGSNFYVLALADYDANQHYWWYNAYRNMSDYSKFTSTAIGQGKTNTSKMIDRVKNPSNYTVSYGDPITAKDSTYTYGPDMWYLIKDETDWFVPSKDEWDAILNNLTNNFSLNTSNYSNYGLSSWYWLSSQSISYGALGVDFSTDGMGSYNVNGNGYVRLCATF